MPTRPVTWELDIPPASLLEPDRKTPPASEIPSLQKLRNSLMGTRFELLKISTFAVFLLAFVAVVIHGSHVANSDNQFVANGYAAIAGLTNAVFSRTASLRDKIHALAVAAVRDTQAVVVHATATTSHSGTTPKANLLAMKHATQVARVHHKVRATHPVRFDTAPPQPQFEFAPLRAHSSMFNNLISPDSLVAGITALVFYVIFVMVLVRKKGGLRALGRSHAV